MLLGSFLVSREAGLTKPIDDLYVCFENAMILRHLSPQEICYRNYDYRGSEKPGIASIVGKTSF
jgi:hypothetical protein